MKQHTLRCLVVSAFGALLATCGGSSDLPQVDAAQVASNRADGQHDIG